MKIRFTVPEATDPRREGGMQLPAQPAKRVVARWRWVVILLVALSPGLVVAGFLLHGWLWVESGGFVVFEETRLTSPAAGTVTALHAASGAAVEAGAPLADLANPELSAEAAALSAATRRAARRSPELAALDRQIAAARAVLRAREADAATLAALQADGAATRAEVAGAQARVHAAQAELAGVERERARAVELAVLSGVTAPEQATRLAVLQARLAALHVKAPFAGTADGVAVAVGQHVEPGQDLLVLRHGEPRVIGFLQGRELALKAGDRVKVVLPDGSSTGATVLGQAPSTLRLPEELSGSFEQRTARLQVLLQPDALPPAARVHRLPVTVRLFRFRP